MTLDKNKLRENVELPQYVHALLDELEAAEREGDRIREIARLQEEMAKLVGKDVAFIVAWNGASERLIADKNAAEERVRELTQQRFSPEGDNHHNAALCPYCSPASEIAKLRSKLSVMETALCMVRRDIVAHRVRGGGFPILTDKTADAVIELLAEKALSDQGGEQWRLGNFGNESSSLL